MAKVVVFANPDQILNAGLPDSVAQYFMNAAQQANASSVYRGGEGVFFAEKSSGVADTAELEKLRKAGASISSALKSNKDNQCVVVNAGVPADCALALLEGTMLANYQFHKYLKEKPFQIADFSLEGEGSAAVNQLKITCDAVCKARDLVNTPVLGLNAEGLAEAFVEMGSDAGFTVEVWNEARIQSQKMGGLLAVNAGSQEPATFSIMEYKPSNAKNSKPIVLVGKGVVFDTGGLSLKPTPQSMDQMKCDMAGSAAVGATMWAVAKLQLPLWIIALVPATDNRPGENATCPGDIITMYDGTTVEVLNTDAEGRLILADALAFAKKYDPELVCDFATLTGAAMRALGAYGSAMMGNASEEVKNQVKAAGEKVYERLAELPLWEEYFADTKGDISDLKNLGKAEGGAQSAAMFLRHFTNYPWLHFDIAGTAFNTGADSYRGKGGTGVGVRLMLEFLKNKANG